MRDTQSQQRYEIGMVGLGVMGRNLVLNMADHGFSVAGYDKDKTKVEALRKEAAKRNIRSAANIVDFIALLRKPRAIMLLVPAGPPVDSVIKDLLPHLDKSDLMIDAGNSWFKDTDVRAGNLAAKGIHFLGVGVSGGEEGARHGPSIMPGGPKDGLRAGPPRLRSCGCEGQWRSVRDLAGTGIGWALREDGPQRHRIRCHAIDLRDLRPDETRSRLERR